MVFLCCTIIFWGNKHFGLFFSELLWCFGLIFLITKMGETPHQRSNDWVGRVNTPQVWSSPITPRWECLLPQKQAQASRSFCIMTSHLFHVNHIWFVVCLILNACLSVSLEAVPCKYCLTLNWSVVLRRMGNTGVRNTQA